MKRNKIKTKYLKCLQHAKKIEEQNTKVKDDFNLFNRIERVLMKGLESLGLILLLLIWNYILVLILEILGIHYSDFSEMTKIIYLLFNDSLFMLFLIFLYRKDVQRDFYQYFKVDFFKNIRQSLAYWGAGLLVMIISNFVISILTNGTLAANEESVRSLIDIAPWYMAFQLMIYAPITEELIFRRSIRDVFHNPILYVFMSGLIFGGLHVLTSLESAMGLLYLIPYCSLGFAFALLYQKSNNIFSTITVHSIHNTLALILYLVTI